ncbi:hypothetical protein NKH77_46670 [Streptomyces sp. M19]
MIAAMRRARTPVERGTSAMEGARRIGLMAGAPLAGALVATVGPVSTLLADAAALLLAALLVLALVPGEPRRPPPPTTAPTPPGSARAS